MFGRDFLDTQEAPKSLSLDSGSSMESLTSATQQEKAIVQERPKLGGAFASYVRHRGEPDGKTTEPASIPISRQTCPNGGGALLLTLSNHHVAR